MTSIFKDKNLWNKSIKAFEDLYANKPKSEKDWARVSVIYAKVGGTFSENIIPKEIQDNIFKEGIFDKVKIMLSSILKSPILIGIAIYFLNKLYRKNK